jgi:hypothetical protein
VNDAEDVRAVNVVQDQFGITSAASRPFVPAIYDEASLEAT